MDYQSPEYLAAYDRETAIKIAAANGETERLKAVWDSLKDEAKDAKAEYELQRNRLQKLIAERDHGYGRPPADLGLFAYTVGADGQHHFTAPLPGSTNGAAKKPSARTPGDVQPGKWFPDDLYKAYPLDRFEKHGLTKKAIQALRDGVQKDRPNPFPILTMGDLAAFVDPSVMGYSRNLTDIKGVGPSEAEKISNAETAFWAEWPMIQEQFAVENGFKRLDSQDEAEKADKKKKPKGKGKTSANGKAPKPGATGSDQPAGDGGGDGEAANGGKRTVDASPTEDFIKSTGA